jgi:uncharacterized NAD-dependent epimerase/dehydratase family protein
VSDRLAVLTEGMFDHSNAKTAHGVLRFGDRPVACVVDSAHAGRSSVEVVPFSRRDVPIVASFEEAKALGATTVLVGIAPSGGKLAGPWRTALLQAMALGLDVEAGLHTLLREDEELRAAADRHGVALRDLRSSPDGLSIPRSALDRPAGLRVVHTVGTNCAIGKMTTGLELTDAARARGEAAVFVPTGQTGIAIAGWGIAVDHVISDYIAGAAERLIDEGVSRGDLLFVEGQGSLFHPGYSGVTLGLLHGCRPHVMVLQHLAGETHNDDYPSVPIPPLAEAVAYYERTESLVHPSVVAAIVLNTRMLDEAGARRAVAEAADRTGLPVADVVRDGPDAILDAVMESLPDRP